MDRGQDVTRFSPTPPSGGTGSSRGRMSLNSLFDRSRIRLAFAKLRCSSTDPPDIQEIHVESEISKSTVYFDGSCPLCRAEIGYYRLKDQAGALCFVDVSETGAVTPEGITQQRAMERFHVRASDGQVLAGAAAFVEVWIRLPSWRWAARAASLPGALVALDLGYRMFLPFRPFVSCLFMQILQLRAVSNGTKRG
jgi:predicted DCC family thiol-disulfide oxidoreductase YuxK